MDMKAMARRGAERGVKNSSHGRGHGDSVPAGKPRGEKLGIWIGAAVYLLLFFCGLGGLLLWLTPLLFYVWARCKFS